jgi:RNA polymerase sigma-32 factor
MDYSNQLPKSFSKIAMEAEMLDADTELKLARDWRNNGNEKALHRLVTAYMKLAVSISTKYRRYGSDMTDLVQEAGIGLMKAAEKFDPERGVRFSTYAVWWIKASIQDYVMRNYSMVRTGSTSSQKSLFFNLKRVKAKLERDNGRDNNIDKSKLIEMIAKELGVPVRDVEMMEARLSGGDYSLNTPQIADEGREWIDILEDDSESQAEKVDHERDMSKARTWLLDAMKSLNERERLILAARKLNDVPRTLDSLGLELGLSKERIRQLESQALLKMKKRLESKQGSLPKLLV